MNEQGKKRNFSIPNLSIVDRYYLHAEQGLPIEKLEGGNLRAPEMLIRSKIGATTSREAFSFITGKDKINYRTLTSPHFIFFYEHTVKIEPFVALLEQIWYSHALRTPGFIDAWGDERRVYFYVPAGEALEKIKEYTIAGLSPDTDQYTINHLGRSWKEEYSKVEVKVAEQFQKKYNTAKTGKIHSINFKSREELAELIESYPFFEWQEMFLPGSKLPQRKTDTVSKLASQKGYLCLIYGNELRLHDNENRTYSQYYTNGLGVAVPAQGKIKEWGKILAESVASEEVQPTLQYMFYNDKETLKTGLKEEKVIRAQVLMSFGRFLEKDLTHMIHRCGLIDYIAEHGAFPQENDLCQILGYTNGAEIETAFKAFILKGNVKLK